MGKDAPMKPYKVMKDKFAYTGKPDTSRDGDNVGKYFGQEELLKPKNPMKKSEMGPKTTGYGYR